MFTITIIKNFAAAHKLKMVTKKCENLHGHNWKVEVTVAGEKLNNAGVLLDFTILKKYLTTVIDELDHKYLNELEYFEKNPPSSENLAFYISEKISSCLADNQDINVSKVIVWESDNAYATYYPQKK